MTQVVADLIFRISSLLLAIGAPTIAVILGWKEWCKKQIADARENSVGAQAITQIRKERDEDKAMFKKELEDYKAYMREENREFRNDIRSLFYNNPRVQ